MAQIPKLTVRTVSAESVRAVIYRKLGVSSRCDAVNRAKKPASWMTSNCNDNNLYRSDDHGCGTAE
jgi:hypothetical protein